MWRVVVMFAISGGFNNEASGQAAAIIGGEANTASGNYSIAMGSNAIASNDRALVINLGEKKGQQVSSNKEGDFLVSADVFTFQIGSKNATINKKNFDKFFKQVLPKEKPDDRRLKQQHTIDDDEQQSIINEQLHKHIEEQQATNEEQQATIDEQQGQIEKLQEQMNELYCMMTAVRSSSES